MIVMLPCNSILLALLWLVSLTTLAQGAERQVLKLIGNGLLPVHWKEGGLVVSIPLVK